MSTGNRQQVPADAFDADMFVLQVGEVIDDLALIKANSRVLVGVSGGADSVALLTILHELGGQEHRNWRLAVAHLNHGLRESADSDEQFVREVAGKLNLPCYVEKRDISAEAKSAGKTVEEAGRDVRMNFFASTALDHGIACVALGHHGDDDVETILYRIVRGTHLHGLGGIPVQREITEGVEIVRPLLASSRRDIEKFCSARSLSWCDDETNNDTNYSRNFIRHELLPLLREKLNPKVDDAIARLAFSAYEAEMFLRSKAMDLLLDEQNQAPDYDGFKVALLTDEPEILRRCVLKLVIKDAGVPLKAMTFEHYEQLAALCSPGGPTRMQLPGGFDAFVEDGILMIALRGSCEVTDVSPVELGVNSSTMSGAVEIICNWAGFDADGFTEHCQTRPVGVELIDADKVTLPLTVRCRCDGDSFQPLGCEGTQKVSDFLTNIKYPSRKRETVRCICDSKGIVYLAPLRIDERVKVTDKTKRVLRIDASNLLI